MKIKQPGVDCESVLNFARQEFGAGRFTSLPLILKNCLSRGFSKEQKVRAYLLLCQTYLILDKPGEAEQSYLELLRADPEYVADQTKDPIDVVYLSKKFTSRPRFTSHIRAGFNTSVASTIYNLTSNSKPDSSTTKYNLRLGFQFGGGIDWNASDNLSLCAEFLYSFNSFGYLTKGIFGLDILEEKYNLTTLNFPLFLKYQDHLGKVRPFGYVGYASGFLLAAKESLVYTNVDKNPITDTNKDGGYTLNVTEGSDINISYRFRKISGLMVFGGGLKYKIGKDFLFADLRGSIGLTNLINKKYNFYQSIDQSTLANDITTYNNISDFFRLNSLVLSVGYVRPVYDPRRIKGAGKNFLLKLFKKNKTSK